MESRHRVQKAPSEDRQSAYDFPYVWDAEEIEAALNEARRGDAGTSIPAFVLDKVEVHPSGQCQLRCPHCYGLDLAPDRRVHLPIGTMEDSILRDLRESPRFKDEDPLIVFAGLYGEPLLYPEIQRAVVLLGEFGFRFGIYTNGLKLDDNTSEAIAVSATKTRNKSRPSYVSVNATASVVTRPGNWKVLVENVEQLCRIRAQMDSPLQVNVPILVVKECCGEAILTLLQEKFLAIGVDNIRYSFPWAPLDSQSIESYQLLEREEYRDALGVIQRLTEKEPKKVKRRMPNIRPFDHCFVMCMSLAIAPEGDVFPCPEVCSPLFKRLGLSFGSVTEKRISQIWLSGEHVAAFRRFDPRTVNCVCCPVDCEFNALAARVWPPTFVELGRGL
jgi:MoaA/NifB/PqqE/SkfB family radical SAM enzyme